jgi:histone deacetylase 1/2
MQDEFDALLRNRTWTLVPHPSDACVISGKWVFKVKTGADGSFDRYKARWVVRNDVQRSRPGSTSPRHSPPVVNLATIRTVLTLIMSKNWPVHQLDISNAFLHDHINEMVYCRQPTGFKDPARPTTSVFFRALCMVYVKHQGLGLRGSLLMPSPLASS